MRKQKIWNRILSVALSLAMVCSSISEFGSLTVRADEIIEDEQTGEDEELNDEVDVVETPVVVNEPVIEQTNDSSNDESDDLLIDEEAEEAEEADVNNQASEADEVLEVTGEEAEEKDLFTAEGQGPDIDEESENVKAFVIAIQSFIDKAVEYGWSDTFTEEEATAWANDTENLTVEKSKELSGLSIAAWDIYDELTEEEQAYVEENNVDLMKQAVAIGDALNEQVMTQSTDVNVTSASDFGTSSNGIYTLKDGYTYSLKNNIEIQGYLFVGQNVTAIINLNGFTLKRTDTSTAIAAGCIGSISYNGKLTINGDGGTITGGNSTTQTGGAFGTTTASNDDASLTINNTTITNCHDKSGAGGGGAINWGHGKLMLENCTITNCSSNLAGGGINIMGQSTTTLNNVTIKDCSATKYGGGAFSLDNSAILNLQGKVEMYGNTDNGLQGNFMLVSGTVNAGDLMTGSKIGIYYSQSGTIKNNGATTGTVVHSGVNDTIAGYFFSDDNRFGKKISGDTLKLVAHTHNWSYAAKGNEITATCAEDNPAGISCGAGKIQSLTIDAEKCNKDYDGDSCIAPEITKSTNWSATNQNVPTVYYSGTLEDNTNYASTATPPTEPGKYKASITIGTATAESDFEIKSLPTHVHNDSGVDVTFNAWISNSALPTKAGSYYLTKDISISSTWAVPQDGVVNLDLNGHSITMTGGKTVISVNGTTLNLYDCKETGKITGGVGSLGENLDSGGGVSVGNYTRDSGDETFNMYGGMITENKASGYGGGVMIYTNSTTSGNKTFNMYAGTISKNTAKTGAGVQNQSVFNLYTGNITGNIASNAGGGINSYKASLNMSSGEISNNMAAFGGGILNQGIANIRNAVIKENTATDGYDSGAGVYSNSAETIRIENSSITGNTGEGLTVLQTVILAGTIDISDNTGDVGKNLIVSEGGKITLESNFKPVKPIGFTICDYSGNNYIETTGRLTNNYSAVAGSDSLDKWFVLETKKSNYAQVWGTSSAVSDTSKQEIWVAEHTHKWNYAQGAGTDTDKIYAYCSGLSPHCGYYGTADNYPKTLALTLDASKCAKTNDGSPCSAAEIIQSDDWSVTGQSKPAISYTGTALDNTSYNSTTPPTKAGNYKASITIETAKAESPFSIGSKVTFNANEGTVTPASADTDSSGKLESLPTPTREGYQFAGWFTAVTGGTKVATDTVFTESATVYAFWYNPSDIPIIWTDGTESGAGTAGANGTWTWQTDAATTQQPSPGVHWFYTESNVLKTVGNEHYMILADTDLTSWVNGELPEGIMLLKSYDLVASNQNGSTPLKLPVDIGTLYGWFKFVGTPTAPCSDPLPTITIPAKYLNIGTDLTLDLSEKLGSWDIRANASLVQTGLTKATATIDKTSGITDKTDDTGKVKVTVKAATGYKFPEQPVVTATNATVSNLTRVSDTEYTAEVYALTGNTEITVTGNATNHTHTWEYSATNNVLTAKCTTDDSEDCEYKKGISLTLASSESSITYDGKTHAATISDTEKTVWETAGLTVPTIMYSLKDSDGNWGTASETPPTNAGSYKAIITVEGKAAETEFKITPKPVTATVTAENKVYDGNKNAVISAAVDTGVEDETLNISGLTGTFENANAGKDKKVTVNAANVAYEGNAVSSNYTVMIAGEVKASITARPITISNISAENKTYNSTTAATLNYSNAVFANSIEGEKLTVTATGTFENANVGTGKTVTITGLALGGDASKNYTLAPDGQQTEATAGITAKDITVIITPNGGTFAGTITAATAALSNVETADKNNMPVTLTYTGKANDGITKYNGTDVPTQAGNYTVTATIGNTNYNLTGTTDEAFVVARAEAGLSVNPIADKTYGDADFKLGAAKNSDGTITYVSSNTDVLTVDENGLVHIVGAGEATITVSVLKTANYNADTKYVTVTVKKKDATLTVSKMKYDVTYGDASFKIGDITSEGESVITYTSDAENVAAVDADGNVTIIGVGTAAITLAMVESDNYNKADTTVVINVAAKEITVTADDKSKTYGESDPKLTYTAAGLVGTDTLTDVTVKRVAGETVGTYDISISQTEGANPNYRITFTGGTFTVLTKVISTTDKTAVITATPNSYPYDGTAKIPAVTVKDGDKVVPASEYTVSYKNNINMGTATITVADKEGGNYQVSGTLTFTITDPVPGEVDKEVEVKPGAPATVMNTSKEALEQAPGILTKAEKDAVALGADARIWMEVAPVNPAALSATERQKAEKAAEAMMGSGAQLYYFDASLFKQVGNGKATEIHEPGIKIKVTITMPDNLVNKDKLMVRDYSIVRLHNGVATLITGTYNEATHEFTFETDQFSTYAVAYADTPKDVKVTFNANGGTSSVTSVMTSNHKLSVLPTAVRAGYSFKGWYSAKTGGMKISTSTTITTAQTVYAQWTKRSVSMLLAKGKAAGSSIKLTWQKQTGATWYEVYWNYCDGTNNYKKLTNTKKLTYTVKKLNQKKEYKYYVKAYRMVGGEVECLAKSPIIHVAMPKTKLTNVKSISVKSTNVRLKVKKTYQIKATTKLYNAKKILLIHTEKYRYYTTNKAVATVNTKGKITAKKKGSCYVYVMANNGVYKKIKVTVK